MKVDPTVCMVPGSSRAGMPQGKTESVDDTTFAPFIFIDSNCKELVLFDSNFEEKIHIFKERAEEGWTGNGRDWNSVAQAVIAEQFPQLANEFTFDSDASLLSISGRKTSLTVLGHALKIVFDDDHILRDILFRAKLPA
ncbi:Immunity protein 51 [Collimonas sp. OK242]|nr:Immunity protein 51 [Collimonas sp. OK242]